MTIWHVQKLYTDDDVMFEVIPYNLFSVVKYTLKMKNGIVQAVKFLVNSRLSEKSARILSDKKQLQLI